jgi:hypothetical protein
MSIEHLIIEIQDYADACKKTLLAGRKLPLLLV